MTTRGRGFTIAMGVGLAVSAVSFGVLAFNHVVIAKRGLYWVCLEDSGIGEDPGFVSWIPAFLPTGYMCTLNGQVISFHDIGTPFMVAALVSIFLMVVLVRIRRESRARRVLRDTPVTAPRERS